MIFHLVCLNVPDPNVWTVAVAESQFLTGLDKIINVSSPGGGHQLQHPGCLTHVQSPVHSGPVQGQAV